MGVTIRGLTETRSALRKFEPDLLKESDREVRTILKGIVADARGFAPAQSPLSGWATASHGRKITRETTLLGSRLFPKYNATTVRAGITSHVGGARKTFSGFKAIYSIRNKSAAGAIYETAGRETAGQGQGVNFIEQISRKSDYRTPHGKKDGRLAFRAVQENSGKAHVAILASISHATSLYRQRVAIRTGLGGV